MDIPSLSLVSTSFPEEKHLSTVAPACSSDAYADYVLTLGKSTPLSPAQWGHLNESVSHAVQASYSRLVDQHTADMIRSTVLDALNLSQTFRDAVSYGINHNGLDLGCIKYRNEYEIYYDPPIEIDDIQAITSQELHEYPVGQELIIPVCEAGVNKNDEPYVSFGVAPNADSFYLPSWRQGLIHEIIHHITGSNDPVTDKHISLGPTEIIARRVAQELEWPIPDFIGYTAPDRENHIRERNLHAIRQATVRNSNHEVAFFERLDEISSDFEASHNFEEYHSAYF